MYESRIVSLHASFLSFFAIFVLYMWPVSPPASASQQSLASCVPMSEEEQRARADLVALGTVRQVEAFPGSSLVEVSVERVLKGSSEEVVFVRTNSGTERVTTVDVGFEAGERYLLYLTRQGEEFTTSTCAGTRPVAAQPPSGSTEEPTEQEELPDTGGVVSLTVSQEFIERLAGMENVEFSNPDEVVKALESLEEPQESRAGVRLDGGAGDDLVRGGDGDDLVDGGSGDDVVIGGDGNDYVTGYLGSDALNGGGGSDYIYAADGTFDRVSGGPQYDECVVDFEDMVQGCEEVYRY